MQSLGEVMYTLGYWHGCMDKPRESTALAYRKGYDKGYAAFLRRIPEREEK